MIRSIIQLLLVLYTFFICLSRVRDHKHRLSDVCGGVLVGLFTALFFVNYLFF